MYPVRAPSQLEHTTTTTTTASHSVSCGDTNRISHDCALTLLVPSDRVSTYGLWQLIWVSTPIGLRTTYSCVGILNLMTYDSFVAPLLVSYPGDRDLCHLHLAPDLLDIHPWSSVLGPRTCPRARILRDPVLLNAKATSVPQGDSQARCCEATLHCIILHFSSSDTVLASIGSRGSQNVSYCI